MSAARQAGRTGPRARRAPGGRRGAARAAPARRSGRHRDRFPRLSGHKLYAPYGGGALIGRRDWLDAAPPHLLGGGAVVSVGIDSVEWKPSPARHEGGTPNL